MDERKQKDKEKRFKLEQLDQDDDLKAILSTPGGRYFIWRVLSQCGIYRIPNINSPHLEVQTGMRNVGLWLFTQIERVDIDSLAIMHKEALEREGKMNG